MSTTVEQLLLHMLISMFLPEFLPEKGEYFMPGGWFFVEVGLHRGIPSFMGNCLLRALMLRCRYSADTDIATQVIDVDKRGSKIVDKRRKWTKEEIR
ncbi:MAG: hypothetical protein HPY71_08395 [Firmicutes bacterium]|nr:hypothetical protein [Bacillota bacterium]